MMTREEKIDRINKIGTYLNWSFWLRYETRKTDEQIDELLVRSEKHLKVWMSRPKKGFWYREPIKGYQIMNQIIQNEQERELRQWQ